MGSRGAMRAATFRRAPLPGAEARSRLFPPAYPIPHQPPGLTRGTLSQRQRCGGSGIRTHGTLVQRFSRPPRSAAPASLHWHSRTHVPVPRVLQADDRGQVPIIAPRQDRQDGRSRAAIVISATCSAQRCSLFGGSSITSTQPPSHAPRDGHAKSHRSSPDSYGTRTSFPVARSSSMYRWAATISSRPKMRSRLGR
jgi:hypothetical protein